MTRAGLIIAIGMGPARFQSVIDRRVDQRKFAFISD
jgi:hypothetical protein